MSPVSWLITFVLTGITAAALVVGDSKPAPEPARDPAKLSAVEAELILNRIREGDLVAIKGDLASARAIWQSARAKGAGYWPVHEAIGDSLARHGLDAEAVREYETAGRQARRAPSALRVKHAGLLARLKRPGEALQLLIECGEPDKLGVMMARLVKESPGLLEALKRAADARDPRLWAVVAAVSPVPAERASAIGRYARSVAPGDAALVKQAVEELLSHNRIDEALQVCADWAKAAPSNPEVFDTWGRLLAKSGDRDRARLVLSTIVDVKPGHAPAHARLGAALRDLGDYPGAVRQFEEVARLRPEEPDGLREVVITHLAGGDFAAAKSRHEELISRKWEPRFGDVAWGVRAKATEVALPAIETARKTGDPEAVRRLRRLFGEFGVAEAAVFDIKVILKWNVDSDVDLDVMEPGGETVNHGHPRSKNGAVYLYDNTRGYGPEHYTLLKAPGGRYRIGVHLHGSKPSAADITVILFEETPRERRLTAQVRLDDKNSAVWPLEFEIQ